MIKHFDYRKNLTSKVLGASSFNELLDMTAMTLLIFAYSKGPLSGVTTLAATQPAFVFAATILLNRIRPNTIPSENDNKYIFRRASGIALTLYGIYLISNT